MSVTYNTASYKNPTKCMPEVEYIETLRKKKKREKKKLFDVYKYLTRLLCLTYFHFLYLKSNSAN